MRGSESRLAWRKLEKKFEPIAYLRRSVVLSLHLFASSCFSRTIIRLSWFNFIVLEAIERRLFANGDTRCVIATAARSRSRIGITKLWLCTARQTKQARQNTIYKNKPNSIIDRGATQQFHLAVARATSKSKRGGRRTKGKGIHVTSTIS